MQPAQSAGKHETSAKRGKTCNGANELGKTSVSKITSDFSFASDWLKKTLIGQGISHFLNGSFPFLEQSSANSKPTKHIITFDSRFNTFFFYPKSYEAKIYSQ